jgi:hypothetical protein
MALKLLLLVPTDTTYPQGSTARTAAGGLDGTCLCWQYPDTTDEDFYLLLLLFDWRLALMVDLASDVGFRTLFGLMVCLILNIALMASILPDTDTSIIRHEHLQAK